MGFNNEMWSLIWQRETIDAVEQGIEWLLSHNTVFVRDSTCWWLSWNFCSTRVLRRCRMWYHQLQNRFQIHYIVGMSSKYLQSIKRIKMFLRVQVPKGLPYFSVDFGLQGGFAHVIEDQYKFPHYFGKVLLCKRSIYQLCPVL